MVGSVSRTVTSGDFNCSPVASLQLLALQFYICRKTLRNFCCILNRLLADFPRALINKIKEQRFFLLYEKILEPIASPRKRWSFCSSSNSWSFCSANCINKKTHTKSWYLPKMGFKPHFVHIVHSCAEYHRCLVWVKCKAIGRKLILYWF